MKKILLFLMLLTLCGSAIELRGPFATSANITNNLPNNVVTNNYSGALTVAGTIAGNYLTSAGNILSEGQLNLAKSGATSISLVPAANQFDVVDNTNSLNMMRLSKTGAVWDMVLPGALTIAGALGGVTTGAFSDFIKTATGKGLIANTSDGSDNAAISISGGGAVGITRGGYITTYGNEQATYGSVTIQSGLGDNSANYGITRIYNPNNGLIAAFGSATDKTSQTVAFSGRILVDDTTEATTATDGSLQTDGGLSVAKNIVAGGAVTIGGDVELNQGASSTLLSMGTFSESNAQQSSLIMQKSASATSGTFAETANGENLGQITVRGVNNSSAVNDAAAILILQEGAAGATYVPGKIQFKTSTSTTGLNTALEIKQDKSSNFAGRVLVDDTTEATTATDGSLQTDGGLSVAKNIVAAGDIFTTAETSWTPTLTSTGTVPVFTTTEALYKKVGKRVFFQLALVDDGGTDGSGANNLFIALPVTANAANIYSAMGGGTLDCSGYADKSVRCKVYSADPSKMLIVISDGTIVHDGDFGDGARTLYVSGSYGSAN